MPNGMATVGEVRDWLRTEDPDWLDQDAIADIQNKLAAGAPTLWSQPVEICEINGQTFIVNGHHRLAAAVLAGHPGHIPFIKVPPPADLNPGAHFGPIGGK